jgi:hypothetical protein
VAVAAGCAPRVLPAAWSRDTWRVPCAHVCPVCTSVSSSAVLCAVHWLLWLALPGEAGACAAAALVLGRHQAQPRLVWMWKAGRGGLCCECLLSDVGVPGGTASQVAVKPLTLCMCPLDQ